MNQVVGLITFCLVIILCQVAAADPHSDRRNLYALGAAGVEYCPGIKNPWLALGSIGYDMQGDGEYEQFTAAKQRWFDTFRAVGSRSLACDLLMDKYGPGASFQMFQWE